MPALNEEASIAAVIAEVRANSPDSACLVVDDGSTDDTASVARSSGAIVASLPFNLGVGGAMRFGFRYARARGFDAVVQIDADGQHDPRDLDLLVAALDEADVVIGARFAGRGDYEVKGARRLAMRMLATVVSGLAGTPITDTTSGYRAAGPRAIRLFADEYPAEYLGDTVESLVIAARSGLVIRQRAVVMRARNAGSPSQNALRSALYLGRATLALGIALLRPKARLGGSGS